jgi:hypothetical protein
LYNKVGLKVIANNLNIEDNVVDVNDLVKLKLQDQGLSENTSNYNITLEVINPKKRPSTSEEENCNLLMIFLLSLQPYDFLVK